MNLLAISVCRRKWKACLIPMSFVIIYYIGNVQQYLNQPQNDFTRRYNRHVDVRPKNIFGQENEIDLTGESTNIPHIIHQTAKDGILPILFQPWMKSWLQLNPKWQYWFWTDEDIRKFISTRYPDFMPIFDSYQMNVARADVFRYFVMYEFGGVYADTDMECLKPLDDKMSAHNCILSQEPYLHAYFHYKQKKIIANSFMACRRKHPFYKFLINKLKYYAGFNNVILATGPKLVDSVYDIYISENIHNWNDTDRLFLAEPDVYQPKLDPRKIESYHKLCIREISDYKAIDINFKVTICSGLLSGYFDNGPKKTSVIVHYWTHMWKPKYQNDSKYGIKQKVGTFSIENLFA